MTGFQEMGTNVFLLVHQVKYGFLIVAFILTSKINCRRTKQLTFVMQMVFATALQAINTELNGIFASVYMTYLVS